MVHGPPRGYFPETNKSTLVVLDKNVTRTEAYFRGVELKVVTESHYSGILLGDHATET